MNFKRQGRAFVHSACNPGPSRPRKVRSTPFPPDSENCVRFLARPLPTRPASLGSCGGPSYGRPGQGGHLIPFGVEVIGRSLPPFPLTAPLALVAIHRAHGERLPAPDGTNDLLR